MNQLFVGIDVGSRDNAVYIMLPDGSKHSSFAVQNNLGGAQTLSKRVVGALIEKNLSAVVIGMEATSVYGDNLLCFLREDGALGRFERKLHVLNPRQVNKFKQAYSDLPKNDPVDAFVVADNLRFGRITTPVYMDDYRYKALQNLTRVRFYAVQSLTREKQRFMNYLFLKCSGLAQEKTFSDNYGVAALAVFEEFESPDALAEIDIERLASFIAEKGKIASLTPLRSLKQYKLPPEILTVCPRRSMIQSIKCYPYPFLPCGL